MSPSPTLQTHSPSVADGLHGLLPARFVASAGWHREAAGLQLFVIPRGPAKADRVDLEIRIVTLRWGRGALPTATAVDDAALGPLLEHLHSPDAQERAAACQALGHAGHERPLAELLRVAADDPNDFVRHVATEAIARLDVSEVDAGAAVGLELILAVQPDSGGESTVGPICTDACGTARFPHVPAHATCELRSADPGPLPDGSARLDSLAGVLDGLPFSDREPTWRRAGGFSVVVRPHVLGDRARFAASMRLSPPVPLRPGARFPGIAAFRADQFWAPALVTPATGLIWFNALPRGDFVSRLSDEWPGRGRPRPTLLALTRDARGPVAAGGPVTCLQVLHPADRRLLAVVERDSRGLVLLTVETACPALKNALVRYALGEECGELRLTDPTGRGIARGSRRLNQAYEGDEATRLALQVAPYEQD